MSSILTGFDPITQEDLIKMGFKAKLCTSDINNRYNIANMSDEEIVEMIKENTYYEKIISNYYRIFYNIPQTIFCFFLSNFSTPLI